MRLGAWESDRNVRSTDQFLADLMIRSLSPRFVPGPFSYREPFPKRSAVPKLECNACLENLSEADRSMRKFVSLVTSLTITVMATRYPATARAEAGGRSSGAGPPRLGKSYRVPYRLTDTNHFLVRVRINGKGPFNFLVDSGAPALYIATETAAKIGLKPVKPFWTPSIASISRAVPGC